MSILKTKHFLQFLLFAAGFAITLFVMQALGPKTESTNNAEVSENTEGIPGLSKGEIIDLPQLSLLSGGTTQLGAIQEEYMLCGIFSTSCPGCAKDADMWQELSKEAAKRQVAFYLISTDNDRTSVDRFARAYGFENLPVLFTPDRETLEPFKITFVPQYLLFTSKGQLVARWNGVNFQDFEQKKAETISRFFAPILDQ